MPELDYWERRAITSKRPLRERCQCWDGNNCMRPCVEVAIAVVRDVFDEGPYDINVCDTHGEAFLDQGFTIAFHEDNS